MESRHEALVLLAVPLVLLAQSPGPLMQSILPRHNTAKLNLIESAAAMPEADYGFKLTPPQRSFAQWRDLRPERSL